MKNNTYEAYLLFNKIAKMASITFNKPTAKIKGLAGPVQHYKTTLKLERDVKNGRILSEKQMKEMRRGVEEGMVLALRHTNIDDWEEYKVPKLLKENERNEVADALLAEFINAGYTNIRSKPAVAHDLKGKNKSYWTLWTTKNKTKSQLFDAIDRLVLLTGLKITVSIKNNTYLACVAENKPLRHRLDMIQFIEKELGLLV